MISDRKTYKPLSYGTPIPARVQVPKKKSLRFMVFLLLAGLGTGAYLLVSFSAHATATNQNTGSNSSLKAPIHKPSVSPANLTSMQQQIDAIIAQYPGVQIAVSITDLTTNQSYHYGISDGYLGASTAKLITASLFLHEVEQGNQSLSATVGDYPASYQLKQLIEESDNDAWVAFNELLGHDELQTWANQIGLTNYDVTNNILTSDDMATLLTKLYQNKLLNTVNTKQLLSYMQNANETQYIESAVPNGVKVYHKAGWLEDRVHDAAIIDDGKNPYVLVIFTKTAGAYDTSAGQDLFHAITTATVSTFIKS